MADSTVEMVRTGEVVESAKIVEVVRPELVHHVPPYTVLASIYDGVMRHVNYRRWAAFVREVAAENGVATGRVLDIACGTGSFLSHFMRKAFLGYGCDHSREMVLVAREKLAGKRGYRLAWVADMRALGTRGPYDLVVCLYDSINYLDKLSDYGIVFRQVADVLRPGGLFVFDVCTVENSLINFDGYRDGGRVGRMEFVRYSHFDRGTGVQVNEFLIGLRGKLKEEAFLEVHRQWIRPLELVRREVEESPLELLAVYDDFSHRRGTESSLRVHFVCRKR